MKPWHRQPGETDKAFAGFECYRDQPSQDRSLALTAQLLGRGKRYLDEWSAKWGWVERARAWDGHLSDLLDVRQDHGEKAARLAKARQMQSLGAEWLEECQNRLQAAKEAGTQIDKGLLFGSMAKAGRLIEAGVTIERLELGEATDHTKSESTEEVIVRYVDSDRDPSEIPEDADYRLPAE